MKKILLFMLLAVAMLFGATKPMEVEAKTTTITVKKADTKTLKKIDKQLKKGKTFYLDVKGSSKTKSKKLIKKASQSIGKVNGYSVQFHYGSPKKSKKGYYRYKVSADNAKLYKYTIQLLTKMYTEPCLDACLVGKEMVEVKDHDYDISYNTHLEEKKTFYSGNFKNHPFFGGGSKKFCNLSSLQQAQIIARYCTYDSHINPEGRRDILDWNKYSKSALVKRLLDEKARGVCQEKCYYQMLVLDQIGITNYFARSKKANHAVTIIKCSNSTGKTMYLVSDNGGFPISYKCFVDGYKKVEGVTDWIIESTKKVNKAAYNCKFTADDIKECSLSINDVEYIDFP